MAKCYYHNIEDRVMILEKIKKKSRKKKFYVKTSFFLNC